MPAKKSKNEPDSFSAEERAAIKERAAELRAEGKKSAKSVEDCRHSSTGSRRWRRRIVRSPSACMWR